MVIPFPTPPRLPEPQTAELAAVLQQLHQTGPDGCSDALHAALQRLGCGSAHDLLVLLLQQRVAATGASASAPPAPVPRAYVPY